MTILDPLSYPLCDDLRQTFRYYLHELGLVSQRTIAMAWLLGFSPRRRYRPSPAFLLTSAVALLFTALITAIPFSVGRSDLHYRHDKATYDLIDFTNALSAFQIDNGRLPTTAEGLDALVTQPPTCPHWHKLLDHVSADPWGSSYRYRVLEWRTPATYVLASNGPDRLPYTADDLTSP